jgi:hypothetical protein
MSKFFSLYSGRKLSRGAVKSAVRFIYVFVFNDAVSGLHYIASNYLMIVINEPDDMRRRKTTNCFRLSRWCPSRGSIWLRLKYEPEELLFEPTLLCV